MSGPMAWVDPQAVLGICQAPVRTAQVDRPVALYADNRTRLCGRNKS